MNLPAILQAPQRPAPGQRPSDPIDMVAHAAGLEAAMIVAQRLGGRDLWLSLDDPADTRLARIIGPAAMVRVAAMVGSATRSETGELGVNVLIPGNRRCISEDQARQALASSDERAAEKLGVNEHTVAGWRMHFMGQ